MSVVVRDSGHEAVAEQPRPVRHTQSHVPAEEVGQITVWSSVLHLQLADQPQTGDVR